MPSITPSAASKAAAGALCCNRRLLCKRCSGWRGSGCHTVHTAAELRGRGLKLQELLASQVLPAPWVPQAMALLGQEEQKRKRKRKRR